EAATDYTNYKATITSLLDVCLNFFMKTAIGIIGAGAKTKLLLHVGSIRGFLIIYTIPSTIMGGRAAKLFDDTSYVKIVLLACNIVGVLDFGGAKLIDKEDPKHFLQAKYLFGGWHIVSYKFHRSSCD
ncbi:hypothetical protein Tco_1453833, partial [Tanacetum coccineum]